MRIDPRLPVLAVLLVPGGCVVSVDCNGCGVLHCGSGTPATELRELGEFRAVDLRGSASLVAALGGDETQVSVTADANLVSRIRTEVRGGTLVVEMEPGSYSFRVDPVVAIAVPALDSVVIRGSGDAEVEGLADGRFEAAVYGSGDVRARGRVDELAASVYGSGDLALAGLEARAVRVRIAGSGDADVFASERLDAQVAGSGDVVYRGGAAEIETRVQGSGSIRRR